MVRGSVEAVTGGRDGAALETHARPSVIREPPQTATRDLASYVSRLLANRLAAGGGFADWESTTVRGAVLLTDVADFTALVERQSGTGPEGIEELSRAFNSYFSDLVGIVYGHGGDVLTIAGDAFFSWWPAAEDGDLGEPVLRAAQAGLAIQAGLGGRATVGGEPLRTRVGVAAGDLDVSFVGGVGGRWEPMPTGAPLEDVAGAERVARPGSVVLSGSAWTAAESACAGRPLEDGLVELLGVKEPLDPRPAASLITPDPTEEVLSPFVPLPVRHNRLKSDTEWLQEMRRVTVLMATLPGTAEPDLAELELRHRAVTAFQEVIARFEGAAKLQVDNKGVTLSGAFGLPPRAHEDDVRRGVCAAEAFREEVERIGLRCTLGVATGRAFCGVFGSDLRREYTMHGEALTLAARMMQASRGEVLCTSETARGASGRLTFTELDPIVVKGRADPVSVSRLLSLEPPDRPADAPMVGREAERELIERRVDELVAGGDGATLVVEGDAGLGKSRLAAEAVALARPADLPVLTARADAVERSTGYYAWRSTFAGLLGDAPAESDIVTRVARDPAMARLLPLLESVVPAGIPENDLTAGMPGDVRADNTKALLAAVLREATGGRPALLIVEDAHWLDSNSWNLLFEVVHAIPRLLTVITTRPVTEGRPPGYDRLCSAVSTDLVRLANLSSRETLALVEQRLGVTDLPPSLARFVEARVSGHPFFCEELVRTMREAGVVEVADGRATVGDLDSFDVPATIEAAVLTRLDRLNTGELMCLKVASVIGRSFLSRTVGQSMPLEDERPAVPGHLERLTGLDITALEASTPEMAYAFRHEITRDVAYELLTRAQRRQLHRVVAAWHEQTYTPEELAPHYARLAHHWSNADMPDRAVDYLERAGRQALRSGAFREALHFLSQAIEAQERAGTASDPIRRALCEKGLGTAHYFLGDLQQSRELLHRALARMDREVPVGRLATIGGLVEAAATQAMHLMRPRHYRDRRRSAKPLLDEAVGCYKILGQIGYLDGEPTSNLLYTTLAGLNIGEEAGPSPHLARMLIHAATACSLLGLKRPADRYAARAVAMTEAGGQREAGAYVWSIKALIAAMRGEWRVAVHDNEKALAGIREVGDFNLEAEVWQTRSAIRICEGNYAAAEDAWRHTRELARRNDNPQVMCWSLLDEAETRVGRDEIEAADAALEQALKVDTPESDGSSAVEKHFATALVRVRQERWDEAVHAADAVVDRIVRNNPAGFHWVDFCAGAVEVQLEVLETGGRYADQHRVELTARAERGCKVVRRLAWQFDSVAPRRWLLEGLLEWQRGRTDRARTAWLRAEKVAAKMEMPFERARARYEIARHGIAPDSRDLLLADAARTFEELGAGHMLRRVRAEQSEGS